jgi:thiol-disulfide isomerase/thioredoxin
MNRRRFILSAWGMALAAPAMAAAAPRNFVLHETPKPVPEFQFTDGEGKTLTLADFRGRTVLLNIWATWCVPCRKEMPSLDRLQAALGGPDFEVLPVSIDRKGRDAVNQFYAEVGLQHLARYVAPAAGQLLDTFGIFGLPATLLIDRQGREIGRLVGPAEWDAPDTIAFLKDVIAKQKESTQ